MNRQSEPHTSGPWFPRTSWEWLEPDDIVRIEYKSGYSSEERKSAGREDMDWYTVQGHHVFALTPEPVKSLPVPTTRYAYVLALVDEVECYAMLVDDGPAPWVVAKKGDSIHGSDYWRDPEDLTVLRVLHDPANDEETEGGQDR